ncbi:MAG TPA: Hsp20/alpha crystallin family protein [Burkholderiaceae bacterium]
MFLIPLSTRHPAADLSRRIERLFAVDDDAVALLSPAIDLSETEQGYTLRLDLPGVAKEAVKIRIDGRRVSIDAEQVQTTVEGERFLHRERSLTRFSRSLSLPQELSQADSSAKLDNGVLTLTLAKRQISDNGNLSVS